MKKSSKTSSQLRGRRIFSETFKRQKVKEIEQGLYTVLELSWLYGVSTKSIGLAKIYHLYLPADIGREAFEQLGKAYGYCLEGQPSLSWKVARVIPYQNLLAD